MTLFNLTATDNKYDLSIDQGVDFDKVIFKYPGDISTWTAVGTIRKTWTDDDTNINPLASFLFHPLVYDSESDTTLVIPYLTAVQTSAIPHTKNRANKSIPAAPGVNVWVYDIDVKSLTDAVERVAYGYVEVTPCVTKFT